ncbi:MAG: hypothetical protein KG028_00070 [Actinobacteria bacterium]|jgi:hypothetical protein|nr:hypothetical protein [Actinomycetota bacterium]
MSDLQWLMALRDQVHDTARAAADGDDVASQIRMLRRRVDELPAAETGYDAILPVPTVAVAMVITSLEAAVAALEVGDTTHATALTPTAPPRPRTLFAELSEAIVRRRHDIPTDLSPVRTRIAQLATTADAPARRVLARFEHCTDLLDRGSIEAATESLQAAKRHAAALAASDRR